MERIRYFRSANQFNIAMNLLSGNNLPLSDDKTNSNLVSLIWVIFAWLIKFIYLTSAILGSFYYAKITPKEVFKKTGAIAAVCVEFITPTIYLNLRRKELRNLISKYNDALIDSEDLRKFVRDSIEPYKRGLKYFSCACLSTVCSWSAAAIFKLSNNDRFTYDSFTVPAYFPGEPFGKNAFISGILLQILGAGLINFGKISIDVYVIHFVAVLSAEYKFVRAQAAKALSQENYGEGEVPVIDALHKCVRHHTALIEIGQELTEMMAFHVGTMYIAYILKFCFLAFGIVTFGSAIVEKASYLVYTFACMVQIYLVCSCIEELFNESTSVTQDAFHENWHARGKAVKKIFCMMQITNQIACRLSAYGIVDLVVPTLAVILRKSYSVCLLLLEVN